MKRQATRTTPSLRALAMLIFLALLLAALYQYFPKTESKAPRASPPRDAQPTLKPLEVSLKTLPTQIRVLRTRKPFEKTRCIANVKGKCVEELALEDYVEGVVLAEERIFLQEQGSWLQRTFGIPVFAVDEAWALQAVAARTYALYMIASGRHKGARYDLEDTPRDQAYIDQRDPRAAKAVARTKGQVLVDTQGRLVPAEYSASCAGRGTWNVLKPTQTLTCHKRCANRSYQNATHYRGMCQWGSLEYALDGETFPKLLQRYYPETRLQEL